MDRHCLLQGCGCTHFASVLAYGNQCRTCQHPNRCHDLVTKEEADALRETTSCAVPHCSCKVFTRGDTAAAANPALDQCTCRHLMYDHRALTAEERKRSLEEERGIGNPCVEEACNCEAYKPSIFTVYKPHRECSGCGHSPNVHLPADGPEHMLKCDLKARRTHPCHHPVLLAIPHCSFHEYYF
jgi:hypothetical protein